MVLPTYPGIPCPSEWTILFRRSHTRRIWGDPKVASLQSALLYYQAGLACGLTDPAFVRAGLGDFQLPTCQDFCFGSSLLANDCLLRAMNSTEDVLDMWARNLLGYKIPHTFIDFPWWVLAIIVRWRPRPAITCTPCRPPLTTNLGLLRLTSCLADSSGSCCHRTLRWLPQAIALWPHATCLHTTPYRIDGSLACLDYPYGRGLSSPLSPGCPGLYPQAGSLGERI